MYQNIIEEEEGVMVQRVIPDYFEEMTEVKLKYHLIEEEKTEGIETE